jgi:hypothetical protein
MKQYFVHTFYFGIEEWLYHQHSIKMNASLPNHSVTTIWFETIKNSSLTGKLMQLKLAVLLQLVHNNRFNRLSKNFLNNYAIIQSFSNTLQGKSRRIMLSNTQPTLTDFSKKNRNSSHLKQTRFSSSVKARFDQLAIMMPIHLIRNETGWWQLQIIWRHSGLHAGLLINYQIQATHAASVKRSTLKLENRSVQVGNSFWDRKAIIEEPLYGYG